MLIHNFDEVIERRGSDCKKWNTYAEDVIPMWIADTDFTCPRPIIDAMMTRAAHGTFGYPVNSRSFNKAVQNWQKKRFNWEICEDWVEFTPAVIPAIIYAIQSFTHPGDKVIIQSPAYHPFHHIISHIGRIKVENNLVLSNGQYYIDFEDLENKLRDPRAKLMIVCNPHNPVGRVFGREELAKIGELCLRHHVLVVSDEIHSDIVYSGHKHIPFATLSEEIKNHCLVCVNPSKTFNIAGMRTGAVIVPNQAVREVYRESIINSKGDGRTIFGTLSMEVAYNECDYYADQLLEYLEANRDLLLAYFAAKIPEIKVIKPEGTYLAWLDCRDLGMGQNDLNRFMLEQAKVALNDGATFGETGSGFMRMNIGCRREVLQEALARIENAVCGLRLQK